MKVHRSGTDIVLDLGDNQIYYLIPEDARIVADALARHTTPNSHVDLTLTRDFHLHVRSDSAGSVQLALFRPGTNYKLTPPISRKDAEQTVKEIEALAARH